MKKRVFLLIGVVTALVAVVLGQRSGAGSPPAAAPAEAPAAVLTGTVVETMDSGGYTYVLVSGAGEKAWAAAPQCAVKVGDKVQVPKSMPMRDLESKTLHRKFDLIYFVDRIGFDAGSKTMPPLPKGHPAIPAGHPALPEGPRQLPAGHPSLSSTGSAARVNVAGIEKAPGGKTVAEIHAAQAQLAGKEVTVRGKVVKFNSEIMGRNWIHIQDGSGQNATQDLTLTAKMNVKVGDVIVARGMLATNKDFGFGYVYDVMLENTEITVESP